MKNVESLFKNIYQHFNDRKIDLVIANMINDVQWANGMDGGYVYGHDGVHEYWIKQFNLISSNVTPLEINEENNVIKIKVHQVVHDLKGNLLAEEIVNHFFTLKNEKIAKFDIGDKSFAQ